MRSTSADSADAKRRSTLSDVLGEHLDQPDLAQGSQDWESAVRRALLQRRRFSVKARLVVLFAMLFLAAAGVSTATWLFLSGIEASTHLVAVADVLAEEIQQARRYEKNYFLYGSDLAVMVEHMDRAEELLLEAADDMGSVVGRHEILRLRTDLARYRILAEQLQIRNADPAFRNSQDFHDLEASLRDTGADMISVALDITTKEREEISSLIALTKQISIGLLLILLVLSLYIGLHISTHIITRLNRLLDSTHRIAEGDFSPILPQRKYRDEFSNLAIALNHMMHELVRRHEILVQSHKMRAVGNLTAGVAHELNNPLNNIMLTAALLEEDYDILSDEERREMVRDIVNQSDRGRDIVRNLLDFARESEAKVEHLPLTDIIDETVRLAGNQIRISKVKLQINIDDGLQPVYGDRGQLQQVFLNLVLNAIDAMPKGGHIFIRALPEEDTGFVTVRVSDTGAGIPSHLVQAIFDPFFTTKATGKGTGLGLSVAKGIVNNHGGDIEVMSNVGAGTTFTVHLPTLPVPASFPQSKDSTD